MSPTELSSGTEKALRHWHGPILDYAQQLTNMSSVQAQSINPEDLAQEVYVHLLSHPDVMGVPGGILKTVRMKFLEVVRKERKRRGSEVLAGDVGIDLDRMPDKEGPLARLDTTASHPQLQQQYRGRHRETALVGDVETARMKVMGYSDGAIRRFLKRELHLAHATVMGDHLDTRINRLKENMRRAGLLLYLLGRVGRNEIAALE